VKATWLGAIAEVAAEDWNRLSGTVNPFVRHEFLAALEASGAVGRGTGWVPEHLLLVDAAGTPAAALPLYRKSDSWGEFVFDFAWADAYRRAGLRYFPKLVSAVPFTPATGPRLLTGPAPGAAERARALARAATERAAATGASSVHLLFPAPEEAELLQSQGFLRRKDCQFHWHNRGYADFEDFLGSFSAEKRKKARRERRRVQEAGIHFEHHTGADMTAALWEEVLPLYASTFWRRGREPYLGPAFFTAVAASLPAQLLVVIARQAGAAVATAIFFRGEDTLYGRYWGSSGDHHSLHFETCYHQGIEYCIRERLARFEPGTQGEHKIARGFEPTEVCSAHWLADERFAHAVDRYLEQESSHIDDYMEAAGAHLPYRRSEE
jgi:predicted N-acyltransferase